MYVSQQNIDQVLESIAKFPDEELLTNSLQRLNNNDLKNLDYLIGIGKIKNLLKEWNDNLLNGDERYWHNFFKNNPWIFSQIFAYSTVLLEDEVYVGGKNIKNTGGQFADFIYRNKLTNNVALLEIKTPEEKIIGSIYRGQENNPHAIYPIREPITGAINQVLSNKDLLQKNYNHLVGESPFEIFEPKCIVIAGNLTEENLNAGQIRSFELYRANLKNVELVTFDELLDKINSFIKIVK